jgi:hypothetical protein
MVAAQTLLTRFSEQGALDDLQAGAELLCERWDDVAEDLPEGLSRLNDMRRHLAWMKELLAKGKPQDCLSDIKDITSHDLPAIQDSFIAWCAKSSGLDEELVEKVSTLLMHRELDSAVRKAFVILSSRLRSRFGVPPGIDGEKMINHLLSDQGLLTSRLQNDERVAMRNILAGLYSLLRNKFGHEDANCTWAEADAIISMVNWAMHWAGTL